MTTPIPTPPPPTTTNGIGKQFVNVVDLYPMRGNGTRKQRE